MAMARIVIAALLASCAQQEAQQLRDGDAQLHRLLRSAGRTRLEPRSFAQSEFARPRPSCRRFAARRRRRALRSSRSPATTHPVSLTGSGAGAKEILDQIRSGEEASGVDRNSVGWRVLDFASTRASAGP